MKTSFFYHRYETKNTAKSLFRELEKNIINSKYNIQEL